MPGWFKKDTTKAIPHKKGDVKIDHNLYNLIGANLFRSFEEGKLTQRQLDNMFKQISLEARLDLGEGYGVNLGYNVPSRDIGSQHRIKITKDF